MAFFISLIKTNPGPGKGKGLGKVFHFHRITRFGFCGDTALATPVQGSIRSNQPRCGYFCSFLSTGVYMLSSTQALGIWGMQSTALGGFALPSTGQVLRALPHPGLGQYWGPYLGHYWATTGPVLCQYWTSTGPVLRALPCPVLGHY